MPESDKWQGRKESVVQSGASCGRHALPLTTFGLLFGWMGAGTYRLSHSLPSARGLGWVDLSFEYSTTACLIMGIEQKWLGSRARWRNTQNPVSATRWHTLCRHSDRRARHLRRRRRRHSGPLFPPSISHSPFLPPFPYYSTHATVITRSRRSSSPLSVRPSSVRPRIA